MEFNQTNRNAGDVNNVNNADNIHVTIHVGRYIITPWSSEGRVFIDVQLVNETDAHDHPIGPEKTIVLDDLFKDF